MAWQALDSDAPKYDRACTHLAHGHSVDCLQVRGVGQQRQVDALACKTAWVGGGTGLGARVLRAETYVLPMCSAASLRHLQQAFVLDCSAQY